MPTRKYPPILAYSSLTDSVFIVTRYKLLNGERIEALEKFDVTDQFDKVTRDRLAASGSSTASEVDD